MTFAGPGRIRPKAVPCPPVAEGCVAFWANIPGAAARTAHARIGKTIRPIVFNMATLILSLSHHL
jgi:hypothetical protein